MLVDVDVVFYATKGVAGSILATEGFFSLLYLFDQDTVGRTIGRSVDVLFSCLIELVGSVHFSFFHRSSLFLFSSFFFIPLTDSSSRQMAHEPRFHHFSSCYE